MKFCLLICLICCFGLFPKFAYSAVKTSKRRSCKTILLESGTEAISAERIKFYMNEGRASWTSPEDQEQYAKIKYGADFGITALASLGALGQPFTELIVDPGIVLHVSDFVEYVQTQKLKGVNPWAARQLYAKHLGFTVVYRALALTEEEYETAKKDGIKSALLRSSPRPFQVSNLSKLIKIERSALLHERDPFNSVTKYKEAGMAATYTHLVSRLQRQEDVKIYVFKLRIPRLDLLYFASDNFLGESGMWGKSYVVSPYDGSEPAKSFPLDRDLESFIQYIVEPREIVSVAVPKKNWTGGFSYY